MNFDTAYLHNIYLPYLMVYKVHVFTKNIFKNFPVSYKPYVDLKFAIVGGN